MKFSVCILDFRNELKKYHMFHLNPEFQHVVNA